ncbi:helix-hairpin-helix domain-containing protein [Fusibacter paucivorans]|uniref:Helix-hairpin-helix domain-containing protein n=1 Tax=Fusibacter paucivorans TaxID=76009 RepID=A0ABS5PNR3_9FIRM|nr:helix-hairpin-helix domain-containing protein [Fusibacter paucivorans]MBS7526813.1 helix-hairpin-helix domain-containing protein [Fusibacter paucivorans]
MTKWYHVPTIAMLIALIVTHSMPDAAHDVKEVFTPIVEEQINVEMVEKKGNHANSIPVDISDHTEANVEAATIYDPVEALYIDIETFNKYTADGYTHFRGIGKIIAERIFEYRQNQGPFESFDAIINVKGIGPAKLESIKSAVPE